MKILMFVNWIKYVYLLIILKIIVKYVGYYNRKNFKIC